MNYGSNDLLGVIDQNVPVLAGAATNEDFLKKAFSLKLNEVSSPITLKSNVIVLKLVSEEAVNDVFDNWEEKPEESLEEVKEIEEPKEEENKEE